MAPTLLLAALFVILVQAMAFHARPAKRTEVIEPTPTRPLPSHITILPYALNLDKRQDVQTAFVAPDNTCGYISGSLAETTYSGGPERIFSTIPPTTTTTTPTTPTTTISTIPPGPDGSNTGAIIGGVVGGVGGIALISLLAFFLIRRKNRNAQQPPQQYAPQQGTYPLSYYQDQNKPAGVVNMGAVPGRNQSTSPGSQDNDNRDAMPPTSPTLTVHSSHPPSQYGTQQQHYASGFPPTVHEAGSNVTGQPSYLDNHHGQLHELSGQPDR
ncbi:hypothetical protein DL768_009230 [Monosporascus sp. mg162]|nr:hypothetical protein DL768_009230 [Monosporascus sp. mg162]